MSVKYLPPTLLYFLFHVYGVQLILQESIQNILCIPNLQYLVPIFEGTLALISIKFILLNTYLLQLITTYFLQYYLKQPSKQSKISIHLLVIIDCRGREGRRLYYCYLRQTSGYDKMDGRLQILQTIHKRTQMSGNFQVSRQSLGNNGASHQDNVVEMVHSLSQDIRNVPDRLPHNLYKHTSENQKIAATAHGEKRRVRESLRARRLKRLNNTKQQQQQKKEDQHYQCQVCSEYCSKKEIKVFGDCGHRYCVTCLHQHINNSIKSFKIVNCLDEDCPESLDISSPHIRALALPLQQKYYKIRVFLNLSKDQNIRMCPSQNCEGFIKMSDEKIQCPICCVSFCKQCLLPRHSGSCDQNGALYFENNYLFKRCDRCKMVLEKNQGCNHMTCKCGYQFCYLCGEKWVQNHKCKPSASVPAQSLSHPHVNRMQLPAPTAIQPISLPSVSVARDNISAVMLRPQQHQASNLHLQPPRIIAPPTEDTCRSCLTQFFKTIFILLMVLPIHIISAQLMYPIFMCLVLPIFATIFFIIYSFVVGMRDMLQEESCLKIALFNIFLYLYYVSACFCRKCPHFFKEKYCRNLINLPFLFPISYYLYQKMKECLS